MSVTVPELKLVPLRSVSPVPARKAAPARRASPAVQQSPAHAGIPAGVIVHGGYKVCAARTSEQRARASDLMARMYSTRGYHTDWGQARAPDPHRVTLTACRGTEVFGTLTLGLDSEKGLLADALYGSEIDAFRRRGCTPCELSRFAIDPDFSSKEVLASLFNLAYVYARFVHDATDAFIEVNPRHAPFYRRMLGFRQIGEQRLCTRVSAPAVFLHIELAYMEAQIRQHGGTFDPRQHSLYPYFTMYGDFACRPVPRQREQQHA
jgi:hypothetical protein